jgi:type II secretory pathway component GspD/PulD (secretin)
MMNKMKTARGLCILLMIIVAGSLALSPARGDEQEKSAHRIFRIINRNASDMEKLVKVFLSPEGQVVSDDRAQVLIVKDYPSVIGRIAEFLPQVRIYTLRGLI